MKRIVSLTWAVVGLLGWLSVASSATVTDTVGREVSLPDRIERVVCLGPGALRLLSYVDGVKRLVGVEELEKRESGGRPYRLAYPEIASLPSVGPGGPESINKKPNLEAILSVSPQVIFVTYMEAPLADEVQRTLGTPVVVLSYGRFATFDETIYDSFRVLGTILGQRERAEEIVFFMEKAKGDLHSRTSGIAEREKPRVYVGGIGYRGSYGIESTEQHYLPFEWNHAINVANEMPAKIGSHVFSDKELLMRINPDVIFIDGGGLGLVRQDYAKRADFYRSLMAFQRQAVYLLFPFNFYTTNIETVLVDAYAVGKILYPERFRDVMVEEKAHEIYHFFLGKSVYDEMAKLYGTLGERIAFE